MNYDYPDKYIYFDSEEGEQYQYLEKVLKRYFIDFDKYYDIKKRYYQYFAYECAIRAAIECINSNKAEALQDYGFDTFQEVFFPPDNYSNPITIYSLDTIDTDYSFIKPKFRFSMDVTDKDSDMYGDPYYRKLRPLEDRINYSDPEHRDASTSKYCPKVKKHIIDYPKQLKADEISGSLRMTPELIAKAFYCYDELYIHHKDPILNEIHAVSNINKKQIKTHASIIKYYVDEKRYLHFA